MREPYRLLDLFSGIGGFSLGLERSGGFRTVAFCEIEPFCRRVLAKHWPEVPCYDDIRTLTAERLAADGIAVDAICGGFPCQDISFAGNGAGLAGERSGLWYEYARLVGELGPKLVIVENVGALLSRGLDAVLGTLASLGYDAEWHCIPASALGAHHQRDRVWLVAYPNGQGEHGQPVHGEVAGASQAMADARRGRRSRSAEWEIQLQRRTETLGSSETLAHSDAINAQGIVGRRDDEKDRRQPLIRSPRLRDGAGRDFEWPPEPNVGRVAHGVPNRVDRLRALGNAVVPQIHELIGRAILAAEAAE